MNTIPSTLDDRKPTYTVVGGHRAQACPDGSPVSVLLLNRGPRLSRASMLDELLSAGFQSVVSVDAGDPPPELETLSGRFPQVRFVFLREKAGPGDMVNAGMRESCGPYVLVVWNDQRLASSTLSSRFLDRVVELDSAVLVPELRDAGGSLLPSVMHPAMEGAHIRVIGLPPKGDGEKSVFPFDYAGIYSKARFSLLGGYDWTIEKPHWQKMDFGFRSWLMGERILHAQALKLNYQGTVEADDATADASYGRFWLKNLGPLFRDDKAYLPSSRLFRFLLRSGLGLFGSVSEFRQARSWVKHNQYRFRQDAARVVQLWDPLE